MSKVCNKCGFFFDGLRCKPCKKRYDEIRYASNSEKIKSKVNDHYQKNRIEKLNYQKDYYINNRSERIAYANTYRKTNWSEIYNKKVKKRKEDVNYKLSENLRNRLRDAISGRRKSGSAVRDLGCTISELKAWLEKQFQEGMSWDNYGFYGWHIDHVIPLSNFDLTSKTQVKKVCHWFNLRPLWAKQNISEGNRR